MTNKPFAKKAKTIIEGAPEYKGEFITEDIGVAGVYALLAIEERLAEMVELMKARASDTDTERVDEDFDDDEEPAPYDGPNQEERIAKRGPDPKIRKHVRRD